ncbi:MAG: Gfo/Idh/MocA family oxidoreductase [Clostridia bacterium]|nr:Gfo/Idh/MocA family oxidoreductase [Clostridia bacterium]
MEILKIGIIGCGGFGCQHLVGLKEQKRAEAVALYDVSEDALKSLKEKYPCDLPSFTNLDEMFETVEMDAVIIASTDMTHRENAEKAFAAGKHVLCEKPMALTIEDCEAMIKAQKASGKKLMIGQICRMTPGFIEAKRLIDEGVIGELFCVESTYAHDYTPIVDKDSWRADPLRHVVVGGACHAIDLLRWIAGNPTETTAYSTKKVIMDLPTDDTVEAIFKFPGNVIGRVLASSGTKRPYTMRTEIFGTKGTILVDNTDGLITVFGDDLSGGGKLLGGAYTSKHADSHVDATLSYRVGLNNHNVVGEHTAFVEAILDGKPVPTDGYEGMATVKVCRAVVKSADEGHSVKIEY